MIPKIIHYCWFGNGKKSKLILDCIESWKKLGFEIKEWNEDNYDISKHEFVNIAYKQKKWAFVTDYVRLDVLNEFGGIYMDTDVKILKNIPDEILSTNFLISFQFDCLIGTHFIGATPDSMIIKDLLEVYDTYTNNTTPNNHMFNDFFIEKVEKFKLNGENQNIKYKDDVLSIYKKSYFSCPNSREGFAIHLLDNSWKPNKKFLKNYLQKTFKIIVGNKIYYNLLCYKALKKSPYYDLYSKIKRREKSDCEKINY